MKVSELEGELLDAWVAKAHGMVSMEHPIAKGKPWTRFWGYDKRDGVHAGPRVAVAKFRPSTDWSWGGPIIEREKIWISDEEDSWIASLPPHVDTGAGRDLIQSGKSPLVAAMRAYVANKYGEEVPND